MKQEFVTARVQLPDGENYLYVLSENSISYDALEKKTLDLIERSRSEKRIVIACSNKRLISELGESLVNQNFEDREIIWGQTQHFRVSNITWPEELDWKKYEFTYSLYRYDKLEKATSDTKVLFNLMNTSFKTTEIDFSKGLNNEIHLIKDRVSSLILGAFVILPLPDANEYQLHSVAGKGTSPLVLRITEKKLPILMSAVGRVLKGKLSGGVGLTFTSSSQVANEYLSLGFKLFHRDSLLIRKK